MGLKEERNKLLIELENRRKYYSIKNTKLQKHQEQVIPIITKLGQAFTPFYKYILFQGGNGAGKSLVGMYVTVCLALGKNICATLGLEKLGDRKQIRIVTKSTSNVEGVILPYLIGDYSKTRIPPEYIKRHDKEKNIIYLTNGTTISIKTYDQGRERLQGGNPDFILVDEEPVKEEVWNELLARLRSHKCQMLLVMTPLSGHTAVYKYFYEQQSEEVRRRSYKFLVSSLENIHADNSALLGLTEQERKMRIFGLFVPPSGLVYPNFSRNIHVIDYIPPEELGPVKYYGAIDFGVTHPMAFLLIAVDGDGRVYIFDMIYKSNMLMRDLAAEIKLKTNKYNIEYIVADSAGKRERTELKEYGIKTVGADKFSKGENGDSNRRAGIMKINQMLYDEKIYVAKNCEGLINEFETHSYKGEGDGTVIKTGDDALDALRYFIFGYKQPKVITNRERNFIKKYKVTPKKAKYLNTNKPY